MILFGITLAIIFLVWFVVFFAFGYAIDVLFAP